MTENAVSSTVDWLSYTVTWAKVRKNDFQTLDAQQVAVARLTEISGDWRRDKPLHGYEDSWVCNDGGMARVMVSRPGDPMGIHVQLPGQALEKQGFTRALRICADLEGSITRIDIATDVRGISDPEDIYQSLLIGTAKTRAQKFNLITGTQGKTCYVGSRESERFLRVYDKAAQTKTEGNWTRIEMECKGRQAKFIAKAVMAQGADCIGQIIHAFVKCPWIDWYEDALTRKRVEVGKPQAKPMTDTRGWLLGVVAQTLARETKDDNAFLLEFLRTVQAIRRPDVDENTQD